MLFLVFAGIEAGRNSPGPAGICPGEIYLGEFCPGRFVRGLLSGGFCPGAIVHEDYVQNLLGYLNIDLLRFF